MKLEITDKQLRRKIFYKIQALQYGGDFDLVSELTWEFEAELRRHEQEILNELVQGGEIGLGLGLGPGGGNYVYLMLDQITPRFVHDIIRRDEGRSFYDLLPQCGGKAADLFLRTWNRAVAEGLKQRLFFSYRHRFYTDEELYLEAKDKFKAKQARKP